MRKILYIGILLFANLLTISAQEPEQVKSIAKAPMPYEWYLKQAELWKNEIDKNPKNENSWLNYFFANRYSLHKFFNVPSDSIKQFIDKNSYLMQPDSLVSKANRVIPNTFTSNYLKWRNEGVACPENFKYLEKAYEMNPNYEGLCAQMVAYYAVQNDVVNRKKYNEIWFKQNEQSSYLLNYCYNVLMSVKPNGILLTFGDNNTFPIWILQDVLGIRQDVKTLNGSFICINSFREKVFEELKIAQMDTTGDKHYDEGQIVDYLIKNLPKNTPLFVGLGSWKEFDKYPNMYLEGLVLEYSAENIDNIAYLKNNFENKYQLDYITNRFIYENNPEAVDRMNIGYLAGIFKLYDHYKKSGDLNKAQKMKELGLAIGKTGNKEMLDWVTESLK